MRLGFVGDIALGDHPKAIGFGVYSAYRDGIPASALAGLFPADGRGDLVVGNLEYGLGFDEVRGRSVAELRCKGVRKFATLLSQAGFGVLNVANNHTSEHGRTAFAETIRELRIRGIRVCGTPDDFAEGSLLDRGGETVAFLGFSDRPNPRPGETPPYNELGEPDVYAAIERMRARASIVCVAVHWGLEFVRIPDARERRIARAMIDRGATLVVGHHPHVTREIEEYKGGLIAYSLGNFIGDMLWEEQCRIGGYLAVRATRGVVQDWTFHPARIAGDYLPRYLDEAGRKAFQDRLARDCRRLEQQASATGYERLAAARQRAHSIKALGFWLTHLHRYEPRIAWQIIAGGLWGRVAASHK